MKKVSSVLVFLSFLSLSACFVPQQHIAPPIKKLRVAASYVMPYGMLFGNIVDIMNRHFQAKTFRYQTGLSATGWYTYGYRSFPFSLTQYRYRIISQITKYPRGGFSVVVRVPVEKLESGGWSFVKRDQNIEKSVQQMIFISILHRDRLSGFYH